MKSDSTKDWFRPKSYCHFDYRLRQADRIDVEEYVSDPRNVVSHAFYPLLSFDKPKPKVVECTDGRRRVDRTGFRQVSYAAHWDSHILAFYSHMLSARYEGQLELQGLSNEVIAFRCLTDPEDEAPMANIHFARRAFNDIRRIGDCEVWAFDITKFFESLEPTRLKYVWGDLIGCRGLPEDHYKLWRYLTTAPSVKLSDVNRALNVNGKPHIKRHARVCDESEFHKVVRPLINVSDKVLGRGIPQGTPISALLANIYMLDFDRIISSIVKTSGGVYYRYCDDILIAIPPTEINIQETVRQQLKEIGLELNDRKTNFAKFERTAEGVRAEQPIQYLGFNFDGRPPSIRQSSISKHRAKARRAVFAHSRAYKEIAARSARAANQVGPMHTKTLNRRYRHFGKRSFLRYAIRAAEVMNSPVIYSQAKKMDKFVKSLIDERRSREHRPQ